MKTVAESGRERTPSVSTRFSQSVENERADAGTGRPSVSRETKLAGAILSLASHEQATIKLLCHVNLTFNPWCNDIPITLASAAGLGSNPA